MSLRGGISALIGVLVVVSLLVVVVEWQAINGLAKEGGDLGNHRPVFGVSHRSLGAAGSAAAGSAGRAKTGGFLSALVVPHPIQNLTVPKPPPFPKPPEVRHKKCIGHRYDLQKLPKFTMIIPYLHETWAQISATIGSVLTYTPAELLDEILFIDDGNEPNWQFHTEILAINPKVRIHRNEERQGLIRAKVIGAGLVSSPVIMFMEPHCVVGPAYVEPLLAQLLTSADHSTVAMPTLDIIPENDFSRYQAADHHIGGFDWSLAFNWMALIQHRNKTYVAPEAYPSPALSGGVFAIWRDYWDRSGTYDTNMTEWGGEHIEMSLRIWRCGGRIEIVPCSRIGHVFRARNPYIVHPQKVIRNLKRAALVWLDERLEDFYKANPAARYMDAGDVTERLATKKELNCKSMSWYVDNIYPELKSAQPRRR